MKIFTTRPKPLKLSKEPWFTITPKSVQIAIQKSTREFSVDYDEIISPNTKCWFLVEFEFNFKRTDGALDQDAIITNGEEYYLINTSLVSPKRKKTRFILNEQNQQTINNSIQQFVATLG